MNWLLTLLLAIIVPVVQPMVHNGVQRMQAKMAPQQQPQPYITFHEGRWWKLENGQWYVWQQPVQEQIAWNQPFNSNVR
ncbi:hypothetical protein EBZ39_05030 [bacterium]|nr:hypothetical protein [bacterium]